MLVDVVAITNVLVVKLISVWISELVTVLVSVSVFVDGGAVTVTVSAVRVTGAAMMVTL